MRISNKISNKPRKRINNHLQMLSYTLYHLLYTALHLRPKALQCPHHVWVAMKRENNQNTRNCHREEEASDKGILGSSSTIGQKMGHTSEESHLLYIPNLEKKPCKCNKRPIHSLHTLSLIDKIMENCN